LQHCNYCHSKFKWKKVYRYLMGHLFNPLHCHNCCKEHYITITGRITNTMLTVFPMIIFCLFLTPFNNIFLTLGIGMSLLIIGSLLTPHLVTFKIEGNNENFS
jgi:CXXC-20-CXXC protein